MFFIHGIKNNNQALRDWWLPEMGMGDGVREMSEGVQKV